jgi:LysR family glycine cleavage system transcriptional activator
MTARMPPLNAVRAFEAVARHRSFRKAAEELCVTPGAVSHQIRTLEQFLGVALLHRTSRTVELTEAGQNCYPSLHEGFERIRSALGRTLMRDEDGRLTITAGPAFTSKILAPGLHRFTQSHPDIEAHISASLTFNDFATAGIDVAVRFGRTERISALDRATLHVERLVEESVAPMCRAAPSASSRALVSAADLQEAELIHDDSLRLVDTKAPDWAHWGQVAGVPGLSRRRGMRFDHADHALQAAIDGTGVVLGRGVLAANDLAQGRLRIPFGPMLATGLWFHIVCPLAKMHQPAVVAFREWLKSEFADGTGRTV